MALKTCKDVRPNSSRAPNTEISAGRGFLERSHCTMVPGGGEGRGRRRLGSRAWRALGEAPAARHEPHGSELCTLTPVAPHVTPRPEGPPQLQKVLNHSHGGRHGLPRQRPAPRPTTALRTHMRHPDGRRAGLLQAGERTAGPHTAHALSPPILGSSSGGGWIQKFPENRLCEVAAIGQTVSSRGLARGWARPEACGASCVYEGTKRIVGPHPPDPMNHITSPRPHLQAPSHWGLGLRHADLGDTDVLSGGE